MPIKFIAQTSDGYLTVPEQIRYLLQMNMMMIWLKYVVFLHLLDPDHYRKIEQVDKKDFGHHYIMSLPEIEEVYEPILN